MVLVSLTPTPLLPEAWTTLVGATAAASCSEPPTAASPTDARLAPRTARDTAARWHPGVVPQVLLAITVLLLTLAVWAIDKRQSRQAPERLSLAVGAACLTGAVVVAVADARASQARNVDEAVPYFLIAFLVLLFAGLLRRMSRTAVIASDREAQRSMAYAAIATVSFLLLDAFYDVGAPSVFAGFALSLAVYMWDRRKPAVVPAPSP